MTKDEALKMAIDFIEMHLTTNDRTFIERTATLQACKDALETPECNPHPKAPHGFNRNASHSADRYVCECEGWQLEWQGLSDDEDNAIIEKIWIWGNDFPYEEYRIAIEQALKEKNT